MAVLLQEFGAVHRTPLKPFLCPSEAEDRMNPREVFRMFEQRLASLQLRPESPRYCHLAIGQRKDGAWVFAHNSTAKEGRTWRCHAEARLANKLDVGSTVYVMKTKKCGSWGMSYPCESCMRCLLRKGVRRVYFTTGPDEYGRISLPI